MDKAKVNCYAFLDTNIINSNSFDTLSGQPTELFRLAEMAKIVIPRTALDEPLEHKRRHFDNQMRAIKSNQIFRLAEIDREILDSLNYKTLEDHLLSICDIRYDIAELRDHAEIFKTIYDLALHNKAPFDKGSDKGFKDACVVISIEQYLETHPEAKKALVVSDDSRVQDHFNNGEAAINCVSSIEMQLGV